MVYTTYENGDLEDGLLLLYPHYVKLPEGTSVKKPRIDVIFLIVRAPDLDGHLDGRCRRCLEAPRVDWTIFFIFFIHTMWGPRWRNKLVHRTSISLWSIDVYGCLWMLMGVYGTYNYSIPGVHKPTNITFGGPTLYALDSLLDFGWLVLWKLDEHGNYERMCLVWLCTH